MNFSSCDGRKWWNKLEEIESDFHYELMRTENINDKLTYHDSLIRQQQEGKEINTNINLISLILPSRNGIPLEPKCNKWWRYKNNSWYENGCEVKCTIPCKRQLNLQTWIIPWEQLTFFKYFFTLSQMYMPYLSMFPSHHNHQFYCEWDKHLMLLMKDSSEVYPHHSSKRMLLRMFHRKLAELRKKRKN